MPRRPAHPRFHPIARGGLLLTAVALQFLSLLPSCSRANNSAKTSAPAAQTEQRAGPLTVTISADHNTITTADRLTLTIDTTLAPGAAVTPPTIPDRLGEWTVIDRSDSGARRSPEGALQTQLILTLEPFLAGSYDIPPLTFAWNTITPTQSGALTTQPIHITVTSVLDQEPKELTVAPLRSPLSLPVRSTTLWWAIGLSCFALFALTGGVIAYRRLRPRTTPPSQWEITRLSLSRAVANPAHPLPWPAALEQAASVLSGYLRQELTLGPGAITPADLEHNEAIRLRLGHRAFERAMNLLHQLDSIRFGGTDLEEPARRELITSILTLTGAPPTEATP